MTYDPVPGWAEPEVIRNLPAFPDPPPPDFAVPDQLREAIDAAGYYRVDLAMHPATVQTVRDLAASHPLYPPEPGHLPGLPPPLGRRVYADPDVPPGVARLRPRTMSERQHRLDPHERKEPPMALPNGAPGRPDNPGQNGDGKGKANDTLTRDLIAYARAAGATDAAAALTIAESAIAAVGRSSYLVLCEWIDEAAAG